jgi:hypothetical protein
MVNWKRDLRETSKLKTRDKDENVKGEIHVTI